MFSKKKKQLYSVVNVYDRGEKLHPANPPKRCGRAGIENYHCCVSLMINYVCVLLLRWVDGFFCEFFSISLTSSRYFSIRFFGIPFPEHLNEVKVDRGSEAQAKAIPANLSHETGYAKNELRLMQMKDSAWPAQQEDSRYAAVPRRAGAINLESDYSLKTFEYSVSWRCSGQNCCVAFKSH